MSKPPAFGEGAKGHRGRRSATFKLPVHQGRIPTSFPMKSSSRIVRILSVGLCFTSLSAQEIVTKWDVEIPRPITNGIPSVPAPKPKPIDFKILHSRTTPMDVKEAPEMPDLPPITGTINVTVQVVEDPNLPDPPRRFRRYLLTILP